MTFVELNGLALNIPACQSDEAFLMVGDDDDDADADADDDCRLVERSVFM